LAHRARRYGDATGLRSLGALRPLGITAFDWIGQLVVQRGRWDGQPVVPASWLEVSIRPA